MKALRFDPATASAPFVATLVDVTGIVIYFSIAVLFLTGTLLWGTARSRSVAYKFRKFRDFRDVARSPENVRTTPAKHGPSCQFGTTRPQGAS